LKILVVVPTYLPAIRYGGPIYSVHGLCSSLVNLDHEVHVFTTNVDGNNYSNVPLEVPVDMDGVKVWYFSSRIGRRLYYSSSMMSALKRKINQFDIVHLHSIYLWPTWAAARVARRENIPYLISPRGMLVGELVRRKNRWIKSAWLNSIERRNIEHASALHVTSEIEVSSLEDFNFKLPTIFNIPNGIDSPELYKTDDISDDVKKVLQHSSIILYLGRLNWKKGLDRLIEAWSEISESHLVIAGNDEENYFSVLQTLVKNSGITEQVTILPRSITGADKEALYVGAKIFVLPSYSENFGNTVLEAMIRSIPVLVTSEVGAAEIVRASKSGIVVDGDPTKIANAIKEMLGDESEMVRMGHAGKMEAKSNYTWSKVSKSMNQLYESIIDQRI